MNCTYMEYFQTQVNINLTQINDMFSSLSQFEDLPKNQE